MTSVDIDDTIAAIASPPGSSQRGIVRVSGPQTVACLSRVFHADDGRPLDQVRRIDALSGSLQLADDLRLPGNLLLWPNERSYTRQPSAELHTIGSPPLLQMALAKIIDAGARVAQPGEFTLRAFLSGRLDLTQAEAVLAVIDAKGQHDLRTSLSQLAGGLAHPLTDVRNELIAILAELEAGLDFAEEDIEFISADQLRGRLTSAETNLQRVKDQIEQRHVADTAVTAVLTGLPNAGKSSLFNCLLGQTKAIVTNVEGTTTDYVSGTIEKSGTKIDLIDTAGEEQPNEDALADAIRAAAQQLRGRQADRATLRLHCVAADRPLDDSTQRLLTDWNHDSGSLLLIVTQSDRTAHAQLRTQLNELLPVGVNVIETSSVAGTGVDALRRTLFTTVAQLQTSESSVVGSTVLRTSDSLAAASQSVQLALRAAEAKIGEEIVAAEIRQSLDHLGRVVGTIYNDDILDIVFGQFCIGK